MEKSIREITHIRMQENGVCEKSRVRARVNNIPFNKEDLIDMFLGVKRE